MAKTRRTIQSTTTVTSKTGAKIKLDETVIQHSPTVDKKRQELLRQRASAFVSCWFELNSNVEPNSENFQSKQKLFSEIEVYDCLRLELSRTWTATNVDRSSFTQRSTSVTHWIGLSDTKLVVLLADPDRSEEKLRQIFYEHVPAALKYYIEPDPDHLRNLVADIIRPETLRNEPEAVGGAVFVTPPSTRPSTRAGTQASTRSTTRPATRPTTRPSTRPSTATRSKDGQRKRKRESTPQAEDTFATRAESPIAHEDSDCFVIDDAGDLEREEPRARSQSSEFDSLFGTQEPVSLYITDEVLEINGKTAHRVSEYQWEDGMVGLYKDDRGNVTDPRGDLYVLCLCGLTDDSDKEDLPRTLIRCEKCYVWQHAVCMGQKEDGSRKQAKKQSKQPGGGNRKSIVILDSSDEEENAKDYYCQICKPQHHLRLLQRIKNGEGDYNLLKWQIERGKKVKRRDDVYESTSSSSGGSSSSTEYEESD